MKFAFYGRVSTEDQQDPESSKQWQLLRSRQLVEPHGGSIVAEYFDVGQSRSLPWKRRPEAARLLAALSASDRSFDAVVIGEPQRAFYGSQFGLTFPVLTHYAAQLWVPEVGGPVDPGSEAHDLVMTLFGGMSKGERMRIKTRVRAAMTAQAMNDGRFLGGRPPYGYQLVDAGPHPNPAKAGDGKRLRRLEPDPITAAVVRRIFDEYLAGRGYLAIAEGLTGDGIASPSGHDPARNNHRQGRGWAKSAVRSILTNPRYTGYQVWARQRREEVLLDVDDVGAGHQTVMRWNGPDAWVWSTSPAHDALVSMDTFRRAQRAMQEASSGEKARRPRSTPRPYMLRGRLTCALCSRRLQGSWNHGEAYYRCTYAAEYARKAGFDHPAVVYLRERDVLPQLDAWLATSFDPSNVEATVAAVIQAPNSAHDERRERAAQQVLDCDRRLRQYRALLDAGTDAALVSGWIREVQTERAATIGILDDLGLSPRTLDVEEVLRIFRELGGLSGLLRVSDPLQRRRFYEEVGLTGTYDPTGRTLEAEVDGGVRMVRVGGGT